jgi:glycosyltransferase involved in cell wall biosynthesis
MPAFSIVIICKNEADIIGRSLDGLLGITDDIIVYDNGSTDGTTDIVKNYPVHLYNGNGMDLAILRMLQINLPNTTGY